MDLQNKIKDTCEFAQEELAKIQTKNHKYFNAKARLRTFKPGDKVWVLNTQCEGKFDFSWVGPAEVLERRGKVGYVIKFQNDQKRVYHINMVKPYISRDEVLSKLNRRKSQNGALNRPTAEKEEKDNSEKNANLEANENQTVSFNRPTAVNEDDDENYQNINFSAAIQGLIEVSDNDLSSDEEDECMHAN